MALIFAAVLFAILVAVGVGMIYLPAGVICAGLLGLAGCYVFGYLKARRSAAT